MSTRVPPLRLGMPALFVALAGACSPSFDHVPDTPAHTQSEEGVMHAIRYHDPFACGSPTSADPCALVECPTARPSDDDLSCDAAGCHGGFMFDGAPRASRHLFGGEGPSCYTCHDEKWEDEDDDCDPRGDRER